MSKLTGQAYLDHWRTRMARGPHEAGTEEHADDVWRFMEPWLSDDEPSRILEFGCAYGRMLRRLERRWPKAKLYGVDLSREALDHLEAIWTGRRPTLYNQEFPPAGLTVDMIFTCTVLQHVTDDDVLKRIVEGFRAILNPGGLVVLFENISHRKGKGGAHMREFAAQDYMGLWPELQWEDRGTFMHGREGHELMIGRKPAAEISVTCNECGANKVWSGRSRQNAEAAVKASGWQASGRFALCPDCAKSKKDEAAG